MKQIPVYLKKLFKPFMNLMAWIGKEKTGVCKT